MKTYMDSFEEAKRKTAFTKASEWQKVGMLDAYALRWTGHGVVGNVLKDHHGLWRAYWVNGGSTGPLGEPTDNPDEAKGRVYADAYRRFCEALPKDES